MEASASRGSATKGIKAAATRGGDRLSCDVVKTEGDEPPPTPAVPEEKLARRVALALDGASKPTIFSGVTRPERMGDLCVALDGVGAFERAAGCGVVLICEPEAPRKASTECGDSGGATAFMTAVAATLVGELTSESESSEAARRRVVGERDEALAAGFESDDMAAGGLTSLNGFDVTQRILTSLNEIHLMRSREWEILNARQTKMHACSSG